MQNNLITPDDYMQLKADYDKLVIQACVDPRWGIGTSVALQRDIERRRAGPTERVDVLVGDIADMRMHNKRLSSVGFNRLMRDVLGELTRRQGDVLKAYRYQQGDELVFVTPAGVLARQIDVLLGALKAHGIRLTACVAFDVDLSDELIQTLMTAVDDEKAEGKRGTLLQYRWYAKTKVLPYGYIEAIEAAYAAGQISGASMAALQHEALPWCETHHESGTLTGGRAYCWRCAQETAERGWEDRHA